MLLAQQDATGILLCFKERKEKKLFGDIHSLKTGKVVL